MPAIHHARRRNAALACAGIMLLAAATRAQNPVVVTRAPDDATAATLPGIMNRTTIVIDAAHGGADSGARIGDAGNSSVQEKDVTLALALKLQSLLTARGFTVVMTRTSNTPGTPLTLDDRAGIANHARPSACLLLHAAASGRGVHLYTSELDGVSIEPLLLSWPTAQAPWIAASAQLERQLAESLRLAGVPRTVGRASVRPIDSVTCPAVAVELAPEGESARSVADPAYQQRVAQGLAAALELWSKQAQPPPRQAPPSPKPKVDSVPAERPHAIQLPGGQP